MRSVRPESGVTAKLFTRSIFFPAMLIGLLASSQAWAAQQVLNEYFCADDVSNVGSCTANEVSLGSVTNVTITDIDGTPLAACYAGQQIKIGTLFAELDSNTGTRYDVTFWIGRKGNDPRVPAGDDPTACAAVTLPDDTGFPEIANFEGTDIDNCEDFTQPNAPLPLDFGGGDTIVTCADSNDDGQADLQILTTWWQNTNFFCGAGTPGDVDDPIVSPGSPSKCDYSLVELVPIVQVASLTVTKVTTTGTEEFSFIGTGFPTGSEFDGSFDLDTNSATPGTASLVDIIPLIDPDNGDTFTITEQPEAGWTQVSASCSNGDDPTTGVTLTGGDDVTCTFTNAPDGSVTITKETLGGDATFGFTSTTSPIPASFNIMTVAGTGSESTTSLPNGTYTVTETPLAGWDLTDLSCVDPNGGTTVDLDTGTVTIDLSAGETITCTYVNTNRGSITLLKTTAPSSSDPFEFTHNVVGTVVPASPFNINAGLAEFFLDVVPGTYLITESDPTPAYDLDNIICLDGVGNVVDSAVDVSARTAIVNVDPGENVACEFNNFKRGSLTVVKSVSADGPADNDFDFSSVALGDFSLLDVTAASDGSTLFSNLVTGDYDIAEADPTAAGWELVSATCNDGTDLLDPDAPSPGSIFVDVGQDATCTFVNSPLGSSTIIKNTVGGDDSFDFTGTAQNGETNPMDGLNLATTGGSGTMDFTNQLSPNGNPFTVTEDPIPANWALTNIVCSEDGTEDSTVDIPNATASINVDFGEQVICTFTNTADGSLVVQKSTVPSGLLTAFNFVSDGVVTWDITGTTESAFNDGGSDSQTGQPGVYEATEVPTPGFAITNISCTGETLSQIQIGLDLDSPGFDEGDNSVFVILEAGEVVTCDFENTKLGSIQIVKDTVGGDGSFLFNSTELGGFQLDTVGNTAETTFFDLLPGDYMIGEVVPQGWDLSDLTCTGETNTTYSYADPSVTVSLADGEDIVCTFTNSRLTAQITLQKEWVGGVVDDTASLDVTGPSGSGTGTSTAIGGDVIDNVNTAVLVELTGETVVLSEVLGGSGDYTTSFACDGVNTPTYTPGDRTASLEIGITETDITCTYTNTINTVEVTLQKTWVDGVGGDTALLKLEGYNPLQSALATATGASGSETSANTATLTALVGETVNLSEELGGTGSYSSGLTCTGAANQPTPLNDTSATLLIDAADTAITCTFTNTINTAQVTLQKAWVGAIAGDTSVLTATGANGSPIATSTASGGDETDTTNTVVLTALVGETVNLSEVLGGTGSYSSGLICTGAANQPTLLNDTSATLLIDAADTAITCTYTNTINTAQVTLQKAWVGGVANDTSMLGISGANGNPMATSTAVGGDQTDTTNTVVLTSLAGETVTFNEALGGVGLYNTSFSCSGASNSPTYVAGATTASLLIDEADSNVTCTFTNRIQVSGLTLQKSWVGGVAGDTAGLNIAANNGPAAATSTAIGGDQTDLVNTAFLASVLAGETVTISETLGGAGSYSTDLVCTGASNQPVYAPGDTSATLLIDEGDTSITCTFTNTIDNVEVTLQKAWVGGVANDTSSLEIAGVRGPAAAVSVATGGDQTDTTNTAVLAALVGETITLSEVLGGVGDYTTGFSCNGVNAPTYTAGDASATLLIDATDTAISCTFTNTINTSQLTLQKAWVGGVTDDTATLGITATLGSGQATSTATGGDQTDTTNTVVQTALVGESVTLGEVLVGAGIYTTSFNCDGVNAPTYTAGDTSATLLIDATDADISCTYTNSANTASVTLQKAWVGGVAGDSTDLTVAGTIGSPMATSTSNGGDETDTTNTAVLTALVGETVTLSEVVNTDTADYITSFSCDGANTPAYLEGATSATLEIDATDTAITCTYTNTRDEPAINLAKVADGPAVLEADGTYTVVYVITATNTGGYGEYDVVDTFSPGDGITLNSAVAVYQPGTENDQSGGLADYPNFVTAEGLAAGLEESWTVTANFTVDPALIVPATSVCDPVDAINTGFYNLVTGSDTDADPSDNDACTDLPAANINLQKTVNGPATLEDDGTFKVEYSILVSNSGQGPGIYDLDDTFSPAAPMVLDSAMAVYLAGTEDDQSGTLGEYPKFVDDESLAGGREESWTVTAYFSGDVDLVDPAALACDPAAPVINTGFYNLIAGVEGEVVTDDNDTCTSIPGPSSLTIIKTTVGGDETFDFVSVELGDFTLTTVTGTAQELFTDLAPTGVNGQPPYDVAEPVMPAGWTQASSSCSNGSETTAIELAPDEAVSCEFINLAPGNIIITVESDGLPDQEFCFDIYSRETDEKLGQFCATTVDGVAQVEASNLPVGPYRIEEVPNEIYLLEEFTCDNGSQNDLLVLDPGDTITCPFRVVPIPEFESIPASNVWTLSLLTLLLMATGLYFGPRFGREF